MPARAWHGRAGQLTSQQTRYHLASTYQNFIPLEGPAHMTVQPTLRVSLSASANLLWEYPHSEVCIIESNDAQSSQVDSENEPSHLWTLVTVSKTLHSNPSHHAQPSIE